MSSQIAVQQQTGIPPELKEVVTNFTKSLRKFSITGVDHQGQRVKIPLNKIAQNAVIACQMISRNKTDFLDCMDEVATGIKLVVQRVRKGVV